MDHPTFKHWLKFDFGTLAYPGVGTVHIKSKLPRIPAKFTRPTIPDSDLEQLLQNGTKWFNKFVQGIGKESEHSRVVDGAVWFAIYSNPFSPLHSKHMELYVNHCIWDFYTDDHLETVVIDKVVTPTQLKHQLSQFIDIFRGKYDLKNVEKDYIPLTGYPELQSSFLMLLDNHRECLKWVEHYETNIPHLSYHIQRYLDNFIWCKYDIPHERYSANIFQYWRSIDSTNAMLAGFVAVLQNVGVAKRIREHPCFKHVEDVVGLGGGYINDVLGLRKAWVEPDVNNLVGYIMTKENKSIETAVQKVCGLMETTYSDYLLFKEVLLKQFDNDQKLTDWFDIIEANLDGNWQLYKNSARFYNLPNSIEIV